MNALPVASSHDWQVAPAREEAPVPDGDARARLPAAYVPELNPTERLSIAQQGFLELRLEAALGRLAAMETLLDAERLHVRQAQTALGVAERALERHRETIVASDRQRQEAAAENGRLKQALHQAATEKVRQGQEIVKLTAAMADKTAEVVRLSGTTDVVEADLRAARTQHGATADALQRECLRLEEVLQAERRDKLLLQRTLDLARANRRALQDQLRAMPAVQQPCDARLLLRIPSAVPAISASAAALLSSSPLEQDGPLPPSCPALTERPHAARN